MIGSALVDWQALLKAIGVSAAAATAVSLLFAMTVVGRSRRQVLLVVLGAAGCLAAAALGIVAITSK